MLYIHHVKLWKNLTNSHLVTYNVTYIYGTMTLKKDWTNRCCRFMALLTKKLVSLTRAWTRVLDSYESSHVGKHMSPFPRARTFIFNGLNIQSIQQFLSPFTYRAKRKPTIVRTGFCTSTENEAADEEKSKEEGKRLETCSHLDGKNQWKRLERWVVF